MSNYPPTVAAQPTTTANPLLQRHQSEQRRRELPKIVETESQVWTLRSVNLSSLKF
uniref:Truncated FRIGIDA n=1 Tax=Arabidopsis thaliana TaxID=3702 RepID=W8Q6F9_ARATH|nr:truncated FRIGIDA [Arabidopsis thaliana]